MEVFLLIVHVITSIALVIVILLQSGKGGGLGSGFGGAGAAATQIFGGRGAGNFLSRTTVALAAVFMATSLTLAYLSSQPRSLMDLDTGGGPTGPTEDEIIESGSGAPEGGAAVPVEPGVVDDSVEPTEENTVDDEAPAEPVETEEAPAAAEEADSAGGASAPAVDTNKREAAEPAGSAAPAAAPKESDPGASTEEETLLAPSKTEAPETAE